MACRPLETRRLSLQRIFLEDRRHILSALNLLGVCPLCTVGSLWLLQTTGCSLAGTLGTQ